MTFKLQCVRVLLASHANTGPPKKRHKGWSPESSASSVTENAVKSPPSSSLVLSTSSASAVITSVAKSGTNQRRGTVLETDGYNNLLFFSLCNCALHVNPFLYLFAFMCQEVACLQSSSQGSSTPLSPPELSVTVPDQLLQTCCLQPVIFKGEKTPLFDLFCKKPSGHFTTTVAV